MSITTLADLPQSVHDYVAQQVTVEVTKVTSHLQAGEEGTFTVTVDNALAPTGVRLVNIFYHIVADDPAILQIKIPEFTVTGVFNFEDPLHGKAALKPGDVADAVLVIPTGTTPGNPQNTVLEIGGHHDIELGYVAKAHGTSSIKAHIHADVDLGSLFPPNQLSGVDTHNVTVLT